MKRIYIIIGVALSLLASCGRRQQAKSLAKEFIEANVSADVSYLDFSDVDSTRAISDSLISALRQRAKREIPYAERTSGTLYLIRAKYLLGQDTCCATFYFSGDMRGVVAFKENS